MQLRGSYTLKAPIEKVWSLISDPKSIAECLPGIEKLEIIDAKHFKAVLRIGLTFARGSFEFDCRLNEIEEEKHAKLEAKGRGIGSSIELTTWTDLAKIDERSTRLLWRTDAKLGGLLAPVPSGLVQGAAEKMTADLFNSINRKLEESRVRTQ